MDLYMFNTGKEMTRIIVIEWTAPSQKELLTTPDPALIVYSVFFSNISRFLKQAFLRASVHSVDPDRRPRPRCGEGHLMNEVRDDPAAMDCRFPGEVERPTYGSLFFSGTDAGHRLNYGLII